MEPEFEKIKKDILHYYTDAGHNFDHTERVYNMAIKLAEYEKDVDMKVVKLAALLHDVARHKETPGSEICHAEEGAKMAKEILEKEGYDKETVEHVCECIKDHRFRKQTKPKTIEAAILQDADRLDASGAMIIARVFMRAQARGKPMHDPNIPAATEYPSDKSSKTGLNHLKEKPGLLKPETFKTKLAQKLAKGRYDYVKDFVKRFEAEWRGEL
jgi:uncharacterized protein